MFRMCVFAFFGISHKWHHSHVACCDSLTWCSVLKVRLCHSVGESVILFIGELHGYAAFPLPTQQLMDIWDGPAS